MPPNVPLSKPICRVTSAAQIQQRLYSTGKLHNYYRNYQMNTNDRPCENFITGTFRFEQFVEALFALSTFD